MYFKGVLGSSSCILERVHFFPGLQCIWVAAVRISGDGGQEGRHLAKKDQGCGARQSALQLALAREEQCLEMENVTESAMALTVTAELSRHRKRANFWLFAVWLFIFGC